MPQRLDKRLADGTSLSRKAIRAAIARGRVAVDVAGRPVTPAPDMLVFAGDRVTLDGEVVQPRTDHATVLLHKPADTTSTVRDPHGRADLSTLQAAMPPGCQPVGRLDRDTTGALLFTTDGDLANALLKPIHRVPKVYHLEIDGRLTEHDPRLRHFRDGVDTAIGHLAVEEATIVGRARHNELPHRESTELRVVLCAGKNRHLRRMCYDAGLRLRRLHRSAIGPITLGDLPIGASRLLDATEVEPLWDAVGGRDAIRQRQRTALSRLARAARARGEPHPRLERWLEPVP